MERSVSSIRRTTNPSILDPRIASLFLALWLTPGLVARSALAEGDIRRGTIKKIDHDRSTVTLLHDGQEQEFTVDQATRLMDAAGKPIDDRLKDERLKPDAQVLFKPGKKEGRPTLVGLKLAGPQAVVSAACRPAGSAPATAVGL